MNAPGDNHFHGSTTRSLFSRAGGWLLGGLTLLGLATTPFPAAEAAKEEVFSLREVSVFDLTGAGRQGGQFARGQAGETTDEASPKVKVHPVFKSKKPIYGSVRFGVKQDDQKSGQLFHYALDESQGTGRGYDRLYFDLNQDLNLENDPVLAAQRNPPEAAKLTYSSIKQQVIFDPLLVGFDFGPAGILKVQIVPRLAISVYDGKDYKEVYFVRARAYEGNVKVGGQEYRTLLGNDYLITGRLDQPGTTLLLSPKGKPSTQAQWWGGDRLIALHRIQGQYFGFSASPGGDKLTVRPYSGDLGTFEIGSGARKLQTNLTVNGSLQAADRSVAVGADAEDGWPKASRSCQLPIGDYMPTYLSIGFGRLQINISQNYHAEGKACDRGGRPPVYAIQIRKDRPFALDFSNAPEVMFACPTNTQRIKPGETLMVKAVLVDPQLDLMIRGLDDTTRKQTKGADGQVLGYERNLSLDPKVIITRADGEKVAEGVMPFG
jgi:hypothetical protein